MLVNIWPRADPTEPGLALHISLVSVNLRIALVNRTTINDIKGINADAHTHSFLRTPAFAVATGTFSFSCSWASYL